jgi:NAD(P)-dependent dehydrogenase (short-subunit alcohol dehydrogenase family)
LNSKKTIIITGTTSGIGAQTAIELAKREYTVYMLVRNVVKGEQAKRNILVQARNSDIHIIQCDLADLASVQKAAEQIKTELDSIDVLINNAGGMFNKRGLTKDGFEKTFAINHLGHFLLTQSLMPLLQKGKARIINVSSEAHKAAKPNMADLQSATSYSSIKVYGNVNCLTFTLPRPLPKNMPIQALLPIACTRV